MRPQALVLVALLLVPAAAGWGAPGGREPDTSFDREAGRMFADPDRDPSNAHLQVYFQGFASTEESVANPNLAVTGSSVQLAPVVRYRALLGIWKDCDGDGYVGRAEGAVQDYSAALLPDTSVCPAGGRFNDGKWVSEMLTIGTVDPCEKASDELRARYCPTMDRFHANERVLYTDSTFVWGDLGRPGDAPGTECVLAPLPRGTTASTGGLLGYADCQGARGIARRVNTLDPDGSRGLRFEDEADPGGSSSLLNQRMPLPLFGDASTSTPGLLERDADARAATVWDCSRRGETRIAPTGPLPGELVVQDPTGNALTGPRFPLVIVGVYFVDHDKDPSTPGIIRVPLTGPDGAYASFPAPAPAAGSLPGSAWDAAAHAHDGARGDCDPSTRNELDNAYPGGAIEGGARAIDAKRDRSSFVMTLYDGHRGIDPAVDPTLGETAPSDGGLMLRRNGRGGAGPIWSATTTSEEDPQLVRRSDLGPEGARYVTFYAQLDLAGLPDLRLPTSTPGTYGADACPATGSGAPEANGWVCDPDLWWLDANGRDVTPRYAMGEPIGKRPGASYHMLDVDCMDGTLVAGVPVRASLVPDEQACS